MTDFHWLENPIEYYLYLRFNNTKLNTGKRQLLLLWLFHHFRQEPITQSKQLPCAADTTTFSQTSLFLDRFSGEF